MGECAHNLLGVSPAQRTLTPCVERRRATKLTSGFSAPLLQLMKLNQEWDQIYHTTTLGLQQKMRALQEDVVILKQQTERLSMKLEHEQVSKGAPATFWACSRAPRARLVLRAHDSTGEGLRQQILRRWFCVEFQVSQSPPLESYLAGQFFSCVATFSCLPQGLFPSPPKGRALPFCVHPERLRGVEKEAPGAEAPASPAVRATAVGEPLGYFSCTGKSPDSNLS